MDKKLLDELDQWAELSNSEPGVIPYRGSNTETFEYLLRKHWPDIRKALRPEAGVASARFIWCDNCNCIQPLKIARLTGTDVTEKYDGAADLLCGECRLVIGTTYDSLLPQQERIHEEKK